MLSRRWLTWGIGSVVVWLATLTRIFRLTEKNIWWDEGWILWLSKLDYLAIAQRTAQDEHPPLHYWLMHLWGSALGYTAFSGRILSVFFGVLTIAVMYQVGRQSGGFRLGWLCALLLTLSRFHIWWSQDIKNYTLSGFFALLSVLVALRLWTPNRRPRQGDWGLYVAAGALAIYTHYLAVLVIVVNNLFALIQYLGVPATRRRIGAWCLAQAAVVLLFAPWLWYYQQHASLWSAEPPVNPFFFTQLMLSVFTLGITQHLEQYQLAMLGLSLIAGLGVLWVVPTLRPSTGSSAPAETHRFAAGAWMGLLLFLLPQALIYGLSLTPAAFFAPKFQARYLLVFLPGYSLLLALGLRQIGRLSAGLSLVTLTAVVAAQFLTLALYYTGRNRRDEYASIANIINAFAQPGDAIVLDPDHDWPTFLYYLHRPLTWEGVPDDHPITAQFAEGFASKIAFQYKAAWVITSPLARQNDPGNLIHTWLNYGRPKLYEATFGDKQLTLYANTGRPMGEVPAAYFNPEHGLRQMIRSGLTLLGYDWPLSMAEGGDSVTLVTYWQADAATTVDITLTGADGQILATDQQALPAGIRLRLQHTLTIPRDFSGMAQVSVQNAGKSVVLAHCAIPAHRIPRPGRPILNPVHAHFETGIQLVGFNQPPAALAPGGMLSISLFWKINDPIPNNYKVFVQLLGTEYNAGQDNYLWGQVDQLPLNGDWPTNRWPTRTLIQDDYQVPIQAEAPPGSYQIIVGLYDPLTGARLAVLDEAGQVTGDYVTLADFNLP